MPELPPRPAAHACADYAGLSRIESALAAAPARVACSGDVSPTAVVISRVSCRTDPTLATNHARIRASATFRAATTCLWYQWRWHEATIQHEQRSATTSEEAQPGERELGDNAALVPASRGSAEVVT
jgi:hypothetical protein